MKKLDLLRQELLSCDTQLADVLMKRFDLIEKIMALKEKNQMQILQPEQESRQKEALDIELKGNVHQEEIADIYARVLYNSKKIQGKKLFDYNIVLIGFMGAGKSTISAFLRDALAMWGEKNNIEMKQLENRTSDGKALYAFGCVELYILDNVAYVRPKTKEGAWEPKSMQELLDMNRQMEEDPLD